MAEVQPYWTYERLMELLETNQKALEKAILTIEARQTPDEHVSQQTTHQNGRGWSARDAEFGGSLATWITRGVESTDQGGYGRQLGQCLTPRQKDGALKMVRKYWRQLLEEIHANGGRVDPKALRPSAKPPKPKQPKPAPPPRRVAHTQPELPDF